MSLTDTRENFHALLKTFFSQRSSDSYPQERLKAWKQFVTLSLPTRHSDPFNYVQLRRLYQNDYELSLSSSLPQQYEQFILPESPDSVFIFINGHFVGEKRDAIDKRIVALPLSKAAKDYQMLLTQRWNKECKRQDNPFQANPFHALNLSLHAEGLFLYLPPNTIQEAPIQILHLLTKESSLNFSRLHLFAGHHAQATIALTTVALNAEKSGHFLVSDFQLEEGAYVNVVQTTQNIPESSCHFESLHGSLKKNSRLEVVHATNGCACCRFDYSIELEGENSEASLNGLAMVDKNKEAHTHVLIEHKAPHCRSFQFFKNALTDHAQSSFEGKIHVHKEAQKTDAYQLNNNLLLSPHARAHTKPNLDIYADDVKASHGATVGQLNREQLFYCQARGLPAHQSKNLILHAFCMEVANKIPISSIREKISHQAYSFLPDASS